VVSKDYNTVESQLYRGRSSRAVMILKLNSARNHRPSYFNINIKVDRIYVLNT